MNYKLKKDEYLSSKKYVWKDGKCLGHIFSEVRERQDIDWTKYKQDKTLRMSVSDRLITKYNAVSYPNESCGQHDTVESAIFAIEKKQKEIYDSLIEYDLVTLDT
tara:strand:- start:316 stop:630 length:315 start_codon:yes stop_codon:yes gene_type:complete